MTNDIAGILSLPSAFRLDNFTEAMRVTDFWHSLGNSLLITCTVILLSLIHIFGHRNIAFFSDQEPPMASNRERFRGYQDALKAFDAPFSREDFYFLPENKTMRHAVLRQFARKNGKKYKMCIRDRGNAVMAHAMYVFIGTKNRIVFIFPEYSQGRIGNSVAGSIIGQAVAAGIGEIIGGIFQPYLRGIQKQFQLIRGIIAYFFIQIEQSATSITNPTPFSLSLIHI